MTPAPNPQIIIDGLASDIASMARTIHTMRAENIALQQALAEAHQSIALAEKRETKKKGDPS